jgi:ferredoxin
MLDLYDDQAWSQVLAALRTAIHPVDRSATEIWFRFFPLRLARALAQAEDPSALAGKLQLDGQYSLQHQVDTSHRFLYGHRYWPEVKRAVLERAASGRPWTDPETDLRAIVSGLAARLRVEESLLAGITAVALMTLQQVGLEAFHAGSTAGGGTPPAPDKTPSRILAERNRAERQPWLRNFLRGDMRKRWTVTYDESRPECRFTVYDSQHLTTAAAADPRPLHRHDRRCMTGEGPIPVECRIAACGRCWVGVLAGAENLSEVQPLERTRIRAFGYIDTPEPKPLIRLACMSQAFGPVSIVIPPWNGYFDRYLDHIPGSSADPP